MSDSGELAARLWVARRDGHTLDASQLVAPQDDAAAYAVQDEIVRLCGHPSRGFKVGSTSAEAQRALGTSGPGSCPVLAPWYFDAPADITLVPAQMPAVEGEFAFRLGKDLPARAAPYDDAQVSEAIDAVAGAIEVVGSRLAGGLAGKGRLLVTADCGANIALVVGQWHRDWRRIDRKAHPVQMHINGKLQGVGTGERALGDPINVMVWLANQQSQRGRGLRAGDVVSTGTCTGLDAVVPGDRAMADFAELGEVAIAFA